MINRNRKTILPAILILALFLSLAVGCSARITEDNLQDSGGNDLSKAQVAQEKDRPKENEVNAGLSNFATLDLYGEPVTQSIFSDYDLVMVNVWGTFCGPCIKEMPYLGEINREYQEKGFAIIGIVADVKDKDGALDEEQILLSQKIATDTGADYLHLIPSTNLDKGLMKDVMYIPHTVFVDSNGNIVSKEYVGGRSKEEWIKIIESML